MKPLIAPALILAIGLCCFTYVRAQNLTLAAEAREIERTPSYTRKQGMSDGHSTPSGHHVLYSLEVSGSGIRGQCDTANAGARVDMPRNRR